MPPLNSTATRARAYPGVQRDACAGAGLVQQGQGTRRGARVQQRLHSGVANALAPRDADALQSRGGKP